MYVCGITPYDATHLGHAATYLAFDLVNRVWRDAGHDVHYVQNVTDVDDPLLERAARDRRRLEGARRCARPQLFREDMTALRVLPPTHYVGAVESIPRVVAHRASCRPPGARLRRRRATVYFSACTPTPAFGVGRGPRPRADARGLRRARRRPRPARQAATRSTACSGAPSAPGEPPGTAPLGRGPAGLAHRVLRDRARPPRHRLDVQGGGSDLVFPHHEMGASEAAGRSPARGRSPGTYVHAGMVGLDGEKMSKSQGNLVFVSRLRAAGVDPMAIRLALLAHHYRSDWDWTDAGLARGRGAAGALARGRRAPAAPGAEPDRSPRSAPRLADDLDAPAPSPPSTAGPRRPGCGAAPRGPRTPGAGASCATSSARSSASASEPRRVGRQREHGGSSSRRRR